VYSPSYHEPHINHDAPASYDDGQIATIMGRGIPKIGTKENRRHIEESSFESYQEFVEY
jgi:hypothetical protein